MSKGSPSIEDGLSKNTDNKFYFKLILIGDVAVGKTAIFQRYLFNKFSMGYLPTLGAIFSTKKLFLDEGEVSLSIWDIAGQEIFSSIRKAYFKGAVGALLVFDLTDKKSLEDLKNWAQELQEENDNLKSAILIGNKSDLIEDATCIIEKNEIIRYQQKFSQILNLEISYIETSAKTGKNVKEAFMLLVKNIIMAEKPEAPTESLIKEIEMGEINDLEALYEQISNKSFKIGYQLKLAQVLKIIGLLKTKTQAPKKEKLVNEIILKLYTLLIDYFKQINDNENFIHFSFEYYNFKMQMDFNAKLKETTKSFLQWLIKQFQTLKNIEIVFSELDKYVDIHKNCINFYEELFWWTVQLFNSFQSKNIDLLEQCELQIKQLEGSVDKSLIEEAKRSIETVRETIPEVCISEIRFKPFPINNDEPILLKLGIRNNTAREEKFVVHVFTSGFEHNTDQQSKVLESKAETNMNFLLGKITTSIEKTRILVRIMDSSKNTIYEGAITIPTEETTEKSPYISKIQAEKEKIVFDDQQKTVMLQAEIINPSSRKRTIQIAIDAPAFVTSNNLLQPREINPKEKITETIILAPPPAPGEYHIHLKLLDESGRTLPNSDETVIFSYKESAKEKFIKFIKGISMFTPSLF